MTIKTELYTTRPDGVKLFITYSDSNFKIKQVSTGLVFESAVDIEGAQYTYEETDILIEKEEA